MKLSYPQTLEYYASRCKECQGTKRIKVNDTWITCSCQVTATLKFRIDSISIEPPELKYKTWSDFTGLIGQDEITGQLTPESALNARQKALQYCFDFPMTNENIDISVTKNRKKNLCVHKRIGAFSTTLRDMVIIGASGSGKSLLAVLVFKEIAYASAMFNIDISFKWIKFSELVRAARWDNNKSINHDYLEQLSWVDFLVIDDIDAFSGGHNNPVDMPSVNFLFIERDLRGLPTIFVCSKKLWKWATSDLYKQEAEKLIGPSACDIMTRSRNVIIQLDRKDIQITA